MPIARLVFAILLLAMAAGQMLSLPVFVRAIETYRVAGPAASALLSAALIVSEAASGVGLITRWRRARVGAAWMGLGVAMAWAALAIQAFVRSLVIPNCGCFGRYLAQRLSSWVLVQDGYFILLASLALRSARRDAVTGRRPGREWSPRTGAPDRGTAAHRTCVEGSRIGRRWEHSEVRLRRPQRREEPRRRAGFSLVSPVPFLRGRTVGPEGVTSGRERGAA